MAGLIHGAIAFDHVGERQFEVEDLAGVILMRQEMAHRRWFALRPSR